jgi:hypothetical protein
MQCNKCTNDKELSEFRKDPSIKSGYTPTCKTCLKAAYKNSDAQRNAARRRWIKHKYNMDMGTYDSLYTKQGGQCKICGDAHDLLYVDHCHTTNDIRGLLCQPCNSGLGMFRDNPSLLSSAINYLQPKKKD